MEENINPTPASGGSNAGSTGADAGAAGAGSDKSSGRFGRAKEFVGDKYGAASQAMRDSYSTVREKVDEVDYGQVLDQVRGYVRSHPGKALLISVGVGFLVGLLLRSDDDND